MKEGFVCAREGMGDELAAIEFSGNCSRQFPASYRPPLSPLHFRSLALEVMVYGQEKTRAMSFMMALIICARPLLLLLLLLLFAFGRIASEKVMINLGHAIAAAAASEVKAANR